MLAKEERRKLTTHLSAKAEGLKTVRGVRIFLGKDVASQHRPLAENFKFLHPANPM